MQFGVVWNWKFVSALRGMRTLFTSRSFETHTNKLKILPINCSIKHSWKKVSYDNNYLNHPKKYFSKNIVLQLKFVFCKRFEFIASFKVYAKWKRNLFFSPRLHSLFWQLCNSKLLTQQRQLLQSPAGRGQ